MFLLDISFSIVLMYFSVLCFILVLFTVSNFLVSVYSFFLIFSSSQRRSRPDNAEIKILTQVHFTNLTIHINWGGYIKQIDVIIIIHYLSVYDKVNQRFEIVCIIIYRRWVIRCVWGFYHGLLFERLKSHLIFVQRKLSLILYILFWQLLWVVRRVVVYDSICFNEFTMHFHRISLLIFPSTDGALFE